MNEQTKTEVEYFAGIVRRYCVWAESPPVDSHADMKTAQKLLAELHLFVLNLPDDEFEDDETEIEDVSAGQWKLVRERFSVLPSNEYWTVYDPTEDKDETVFSLLSDDLADIYRDIKYGLLLFDAGYISDAIWEWKFNFNIHWGRHLVDAQKGNSFVF